MNSLSDSSIQAPSPGRRRFIRTAAGGLIVAAAMPSLVACGIPDAATEAWRSDVPDESIIRWGLSYGILAPNPHNLQPWLVDVSTPQEMLLSIDADRLLPETDPFSRQIMIGTGAMLGVFALAVATKGYAVETRWIAESDQSSRIDTSKPLLHIRVVKDATVEATQDTQALFAQIRNRRTVRGNYDPDRTIDPANISKLTQFETGEQSIGVIQRQQSPDQFSGISQWVKDAWRIELSTPNTSLESMRLLRIGGKEINRHRDGITIDSAFLVLMSKLGLVSRSEPLKVGSTGFNRQVSDFNESVNSTSGWWYLLSDNNSRKSQIDAGRSYVMAQLKATQLGLVMHPTSQGLQEYDEVSEIRTKLLATLEQLAGKSGQTVQMLSRIGYLPQGVDLPGPAPRRGVNAHIIGA